MIASMIGTVYQKTTVKSVLLFLVAFIIMQILLNIGPVGLAKIESIAPGTKILDLRFNYSAADAHETLDKLGSEGRSAYIGLIITDFIYIVVYTGLFLTALTLIVRYFFSSAVWLRMILILPVIGAACDVIENTVTLVQIGTFPNESLQLYGVSNGITIIKFVIAFPVTFAVSLGGLAAIVAFVLKKIRKK